MSWNYRCIRDDVTADRPHDVYGIHECYYDDDGNIDMWTTDPVTLGHCESTSEIVGMLGDCRAALCKPVLLLSELSNQFKGDE